MARAYYPNGSGYTPWTADMVGAASVEHNHKEVIDSGDNRKIYFNYSADGLNNADWCAVWNGSTLQSMHRNTMRTNIGAASQNIIMVQSSQPTDPNCKIWVKI